MKVLQLGLSAQSPVLVYDKTKPYLAGRAFSKTISGTPVYGPPLTGFTNVQLDTGAAVLGSKTTANGRMFVLQTITTGLATIALYNVDNAGQTAPAYVGRILVRVPNAAATTHTFRGFEVYDGPNNATVTGWQIYIGTVGSVLINGGLFIVHNIDLADFSPLSPPTIGTAITSNDKAVYMAQDPGTIGVNNTLTAMQGMSHDPTTRRIYFHNNVLATTQFAVFDPAASPAVVLQTTTAATASGSPTFTLTGHGYNNNDPVVITANAPTGFTASTAVAAQTVYFVRNAAANTFELSATSGGASINATSITSNTVVTRAFGQSVSQWLSIRTGTVTGFVGTFLVTNVEAVVTPTQTLDPNIPAAVNNQRCLFVSTNSNFYLIKISEITNGATTFPSMVTVNALGTGTDYTAIAPINAVYSEVIGRVIYISNTSQFYYKSWLSGSVGSSFGGLNTLYLENSANTPYSLAGVTIGNLDILGGIVYLALTTIGQRGILYMDLRSDSAFNYSYVTSPVVDTSQVLFPKTIQTIEKLFDVTSPMVFSYKTASSSANAIFNDPTTGWTMVATAADLSAIALSNFTQFRIDFNISSGSTNTPAQINELFLSYTGKNEISDNWAGSVDNTTGNSASPAYTAFRLQTAYTATVPTLYFRAYDDSGNLVISANTAANPSFFKYSTNNGTSWTALGTIPNTPLTTEVRYEWASPPGVRVTCSLKEV